MLIVIWPSAVAKEAEVWRVLDLSGLSSSVRQSRNFVRAGFVYLDGQPINSIRDTMEVGRNYRLEVRFPNGVVNSIQLRLVNPTRYKPRINQPDTRYHKP